jgi:hypothetical protein
MRKRAKGELASENLTFVLETSLVAFFDSGLPFTPVYFQKSRTALMAKPYNDF